MSRLKYKINSKEIHLKLASRGICPCYFPGAESTQWGLMFTSATGVGVFGARSWWSALSRAGFTAASTADTSEGQGSAEVVQHPHHGVRADALGGRGQNTLHEEKAHHRPQLWTFQGLSLDELRLCTLKKDLGKG